MQEKNALQNVLKSFRVRMGDAWTQETTGTEIGVSRGTYNAWETGKSMPDQMQLKRIAIAFELNAVEEDILYRAAASVVPRLHNLPRPAQLFIGREQALREIDAIFKDTQPQLPEGEWMLALDDSLHYSSPKHSVLGQYVMISGLGGIGKTQLALTYAHKCFQEGRYRAVFWIDAGSQSALSASIKSIEQTLSFRPSSSRKLPNYNPITTRTALYSVERWLNEHPGWLIVVDDVSDSEINKSLPTALRGDYLFTSQSQIVFDLGINAQIALEEFGTDEGVYFLLRRSGILQANTSIDRVPQDIRAEALWLVLMLGGHALALDQVGAYIEESRISLLEYMRLFHEQYRVLLSIYNPSGATRSSHPETVASTIMLSIKRASTLNPNAADILYFCACLSPDEMPEDVLAKDVDLWPDTIAFHASISALRRYSLIERNAEHKTYAMHRIVQVVISSTMSPEVTRSWRRRVIHAIRLAREVVPAGTDLHYWDQIAAYIQHVDSWEADDDPVYIADVNTLQSMLDSL